MTAYFNEIDPFAAQWLRELIAAGHIAPGDVDTRSIEDVTPDDLRNYTQCHFFAGIGVWSYSLRSAGWPDDRPVWTGSCPCQPFSAAGKGGGFADERHLWPAFHHLIRECGPPVVLGEQVASKDGLAWLDLVQADLEGTGYASAAVDLCAAGVGAPHIRQRLWWIAERLDDAAGSRHIRAVEGSESNPRNETRLRVPDVGCSINWMDDDDDARLEGHRSGHQAAPGHGQGPVRPVAEASEPGGLEHPANTRYAERNLGNEAGSKCATPEGEQIFFPDEGRGRSYTTDAGELLRPARPTDGFWRDADWLFCRDGKWRPVEPGTFPLVDGAPARVGRLRGYGNAIVAPAAQAFIEAYLEARAEPVRLTDVSTMTTDKPVPDIFS